MLVIGRGSFRFVGTVIYQLWAHLIWVLKFCKPGKKFSVKVNIDILCNQRSVQLLYETLDILIEALGAFTVRQS